MTTCLPERTFYTLDDVSLCWKVSKSDLQQWLIHGDLSASVLLPLMSVYEFQQEAIRNQHSISSRLRHWEGYASISRHCCTRLFKYGRIYLREFVCHKTNAKLSLPETAEDLRINAPELLILRRERQRFESAHGIQPQTPPPPITEQIHEPTIIADPSFRIIQIDGAVHRFGEKQAAVLRLLNEAAQRGEPWQNGKQLLQKAGSQSFTLSNIFKHKPVWKKLIISTGAGSYRIQKLHVCSSGTQSHLPTRALL